MRRALAASVVYWATSIGAVQLPETVGETRGLCFSSDAGAPIVTSIYSLPSSFFAPAEAEHFLDAVHRLAARRDIVVLTDLPLPSAPRRYLVATDAADYSPWPRDPFSLARDADGNVQVVVRPNIQPGREADNRLGQILVQGLAAPTRRAWGAPKWLVAPVPFHNGQLLLDRNFLWLSIHSVEQRVLELLGVSRVPVETFTAPAGVARYAAAARKAAEELGTLFGRSVHFVHPLPLDGADGPAVMATLGGGAGFDLDSWLTLLQPADRPTVALIADLSLAVRLMPSPTDPAWEELRQLYRFAAPAADLRRLLSAAQQSAHAVGLERFLNLVADHLAGTGMFVERLPAILVPVSLLGRPELVHPDFVLGWNNVVVERTGDGLRAEGFASGLAPLDAEAERRFAAVGARLALLPPLVESVVRNGGYRCASNHLRSADCAETSGQPEATVRRR